MSEVKSAPSRMRAVLTVFLSGPASLGILNEVEKLRPFSQFIERIVLNFRSFVYALWMEVEAFISFEIPASKDLLTIILLLSAPLLTSRIFGRLLGESPGSSSGESDPLPLGYYGNILCAFLIVIFLASMQVLLDLVYGLFGFLAFFILVYTSLYIYKLIDYERYKKIGAEFWAFGKALMILPAVIGIIFLLLVVPIMSYINSDTIYFLDLFSYISIYALILIYATVNNPAPSYIVLWATGLFMLDLLASKTGALDGWLLQQGI